MKIVILDAYAADPGDCDWSEISKLGTLVRYERTAPEEVAERIADAEMVLTNKVRMTREMIEGAAKLKYIGELATGYDNIDIRAAREKGVTVCNIPAYSTDSVAQLVFAHLLEICLHVGHHSSEVHKMRWSNNPDFVFWDYPLTELAGKTMGIIGYGRIGQKVAQIARAFGMNVLAYTRTKRDECCVTLDEVLAKADVITLHCPLFPETRHLINRGTLSKMKDGVIIINTSRGAVIDDEALREALLSGKVRAAGLDVAAREPIPVDHPLLGMENVFITPHFGWASCEARQRLMEICEKNIRAFIDGRPVNVVN